MIGINLWFIPQISEHCPVRYPDRLDLKVVVFRRPGMESIFIPNEGMAHEWITSFLEVITRTHMLLGAIILLVTSSKRSFAFCFINLSYDRFLISG